MIVHHFDGALVKVAHETWVNPTAVAAVKARSEVVGYDNAGQANRKVYTDIVLTCGDYVVVENDIAHVLTALFEIRQPLAGGEQS